MKILAFTAVLVLAPALAEAQSHVYQMKIVLDGVTYQGEFVWTPNTVNGCVGLPLPGGGTYSDVSISDPPLNLTFASDWFTASDCLNMNDHSIWFSTPGAILYVDPTAFQLNVIPQGAMGAPSVPIAAVTVYRLGAMTATCSPCAQATMMEVQTSVNGTTLPSATNTTRIVDSQHNRWTLVNGKVVLNGTPTPSSGAIMLLYSAGIVYQENFHHGWWKWVSGKWVVDTSLHTGYSCTDPD